MDELIEPAKDVRFIDLFVETAQNEEHKILQKTTSMKRKSFNTLSTSKIS